MSGNISKCVFPCSKKFADIQKNDVMFSSTMYNITDDPKAAVFGNVTYDKKTRFLEPDSFFLKNLLTGETSTQFFDAQGKLMQKIQKSSSLGLYEKYMYKYDKNNNIISEHVVDDNGKLIEHNDFRYDKDNNMVEKISTIDNKSYIKYKYDKNGNEIASEEGFFNK